jgi:uncharacterized protein (TIGR03000 family)
MYSAPGGPGYERIPDPGMMKKAEEGDPAAPKKKIEGDPGTPDKPKKKVEGADMASAPAEVVIAAAAGVTIRVNGQVTPRKTEMETFLTPDLQAGRTYAYQVEAEATIDGKPVRKTRRVEVRAGWQTQVDFTDLKPAAVAKGSETARVTILLPEGAKLYVEGKPIAASGKKTFETPKLEKGRVYSYTMRAERTADNTSQTRRVSVEAGKAVTVDFRTHDVAAR